MKKLKLLALLFLGGLLVTGYSLNSVGAAPNNIQRVNISTAGNESNGDVVASQVSMSGNGRYVAFTSSANNIVANDTNTLRDVFVRDTMTNTTTIASTSDSGGLANAESNSAKITFDGRYVVFASSASNLIANDTNDREDVFKKDLQTGVISLVSSNSSGTIGNSYSNSPAVSADGRFIVFRSWAWNFTTGLNTNNDKVQLYLKDTNTGNLKLISKNTTGGPSNAAISDPPSISCDGGVIVFASPANDLLSSDTNSRSDIFVSVLGGEADELQSVALTGNDESHYPVVSCNGNAIAFYSLASNLVGDDTNSNWDYFKYDTVVKATTRVSVSSTGAQSSEDMSGYVPAMSGNGRYVVFGTNANNFVSNDTSSTTTDVYIRDTKNNTTQLLSYNTINVAAGFSWASAISEDGSRVSFNSTSANLVANDTNTATDTFTIETDL